MEILEIYCNYRVLGKEKRKIYTHGGEHERAVCSERMTVKVPDGWNIFQNTYGQTVVEAPWGWTYGINEVLQGDEHPCFYALDEDEKGHRVYLEVIDE